MRTVTFQVVEGVDKGKLFRELPLPVTIGREEGNALRLNDERVSRYHAKVQLSEDDLILTDLESTNGTRVNGHVVQIRRLRYGDRVNIGRSVLLFGSNGEIEARMAMLQANARPTAGGTPGEPFVGQEPATLSAGYYTAPPADDFNFDLNVKDQVTVTDGTLFIGKNPLPVLPQKLTPAQSARLAEIFDFLHHQLTRATENVHANDEGTQVALGFADWQRVLAVEMLLARYVRAVADPEALEP